MHMYNIEYKKHITGGWWSTSITLITFMSPLVAVLPSSNMFKPSMYSLSDSLQHSDCIVSSQPVWIFAFCYKEELVVHVLCTPCNPVNGLEPFSGGALIETHFETIMFIGSKFLCEILWLVLKIWRGSCHR